MLNTMKNANTVGSLTEKFMQYTLVMTVSTQDFGNENLG